MVVLGLFFVCCRVDHEEGCDDVTDELFAWAMRRLPLAFPGHVVSIDLYPACFQLTQ